MSDRLFTIRGIRRAGIHGPVQQAAVVRCSGCREEDSVVMTGHRRMPPEAIHRKFAQAGWAIGRKEADDLCPACVAKKKVATDLGIPRAWVETIRDENFGPLKDNAETRKLLAEVEELVKQVRGVETKAADLLRKAQEIRKAVA